jgi:uncharacterized protein YndB with AHSA1/START domain
MSFELIFERTSRLRPEQIWQAWTKPEILMQWFCPAPWRVTACEIDLKVGGGFQTVMQSPEGESFPHLGCYLEIIPNQRLVWTNALLPGFVPADKVSPCITAIITLTPQGQGTHYLARALHKSEEDRQAHAAMGFEEGWGLAFEQLEQTMRSLG